VIIKTGEFTKTLDFNLKRSYKTLSALLATDTMSVDEVPKALQEARAALVVMA
jgi:hypothetical protein